MQVRCLHCHESTSLADDADVTRITCSTCGGSFSLTQAETDTYVQQQVRSVGHLELITEVGAGAFGSVWKARDTKLDRIVAVKIPRKGALTPEESEWFLREARAAGQLRHPNIVTVHEAGRIGDTLYIVSDFIEGAPLDDWLTARRPGPRPSADLCAQVADALHHAHEKGVIHRDLKPANIMIDAEGRPHLMDFGLARRDAGEATMTIEGRILGTPAYMSPEQARGQAHNADRRTDVYSLGVLLFRLLTGELPFRGNAQMLILQILRDDPPSPRKLVATVPRDLETICLRCLEKAPERRYATAAEVAADLRRYLGGEPIQARPVGAVERAWKWVKRNKVVASAAAIVVAALTAGTIVSSVFAVKASQEAARATANEKLAASERDAARKSAAESRYRTVRLAVATGTRFRDINDLNQTLLWYIRAWQLDDPNDAAAVAAHRLRVGSALSQFPEMVGAMFHSAPVRDARFAPGGRAILTHTGGPEVYLWNAEGSQLRFPPLRHNGAVRHAGFSPDGRQIVVADGGLDLHFWNAADGKPAFRLQHPAPLVYFAFNSMGSLIATCSEDGNVRLWDLKTKQLKHTLPLSATDPPVFSAFDSTGGRLVTANRAEGARLWDPATGQPVGAELPYHGRQTIKTSGWGRDPLFHPNGEWLLTATTASLHLCETSNGKEIASRNVGSLPQPGRRILYSPDGKRLGFVRAAGLELLDGTSLKTQMSIPHPREIPAATFAPNGRFLASASSGGLIHLWDVGTGEAVSGWPLPRCASEVTALSFSPEPDSPRLLVASRDGTVRIWSIEQERPEPYRYDCGNAHHWMGRQSGTSSDGRGRLLYSIREKRVALHDPRALNAAPRWVYGCPDAPSALALSADGRRAVLCTEAGIRSLDAATGRPLAGHDPAVFPKGVHHLALDRSGRLAALLEDPHPHPVWGAMSAKSLAVWDLDLGKRVFGPIAIKAYRVTISPDGRKAAAGLLTNSAALWDLGSQQPIPLVGYRQGGVVGPVFRDDGKTLLIYGSNTTARAWDTDSGLPVSPTLRHPTFVRSAAVAPNGRHLATVDAAGLLRAWDAASGDLLSQWSLGELYSSPRGSGTVCWFSADGQRIIAGAPGDATVRPQLWTFPLPRYDGSQEDLYRLGRLLTGQQFDAGEGLEFLAPTTFVAALAAHREAFLRWNASKKGSPPDARAADPPDVVETNPHRRAARWVLSLGGKVQVLVGNARRDLKTVEDLPAEDFRLALVDLRQNRQVGDDGLMRLMHLSSIQYIDLAYTPVTDIGLAHLSGLNNLGVLRLGSMRVGDAGMAHLQNLTRVRQLTLFNTRVGDAGLEHLKNFTELTYLDLGGTQVTDAGLAIVARFNKLAHLELNGLLKVSDAGLTHLKSLINLTGLHVLSTSVGDAGLEHLKDLGKLTLLDLSRTRVTDAGLAHLMHLDQLKEVHLYDTQVTAAGAAELQQALPNCQIRFGPMPK